MPLRRDDTEKALMEAAAHGEGVEGRAEKLLNVFQSDLFQALIDIQEFYELSICESQSHTEPDPDPDQKYRYHDDETSPIDPSPGHMTQGRNSDHASSHPRLDGYPSLTVSTLNY
ncbi:unnamed protein product [Knipowitschia caucasica]